MRLLSFLGRAAPALALLAAPVAGVADPAAPTLESVTAVTLSGSPDVLAARAASARADAQTEQAVAAGRGAVRLSGQVGQSYSDFGPGFGSLTPRTVALGYERTVYDGGATRAGVASARAAQAASRADEAVVRAQLTASVAAAWLQLSVAEGEVQRADSLLTAMTRFERDATLQFEAGEVPRSVVAQATARRARAQAGLDAARGGRDRARSALLQLTGVEVATATAPASFPPIPTDLAEARALLDQHPALAAAAARMEAAEGAIALARGRAGPMATAGLRAVHVRDEVLPGYRNDGVEAQVRVSVPLWDGGARGAAVASARADLTAAQARRDATRRVLEDALRQAWIGRATAQAEVQAAGAQVEAARSALTSMEAEFRVGERPLIDVLDARADLAGAETALAVARAAFLLSHWQINAALGREGLSP